MRISYGTATLCASVAACLSTFLALTAVSSASWIWDYEKSGDVIMGSGLWCASYKVANLECSEGVCLRGAFNYECVSWQRVRSDVGCEVDIMCDKGSSKIPPRILGLQVLAPVTFLLCLMVAVFSCVGTLSLGQNLFSVYVGICASTSASVVALTTLLVYSGWSYVKELKLGEGYTFLEDENAKVVAIPATARWRYGSSFTSTAFIVITSAAECALLVFAIMDERRSKRKREAWKRALLSRRTTDGEVLEQPVVDQ